MDVKAKKLRREGYVTGNLFGREIEGSLPIKMTKKAVDQLLKTDNKGSQIMLEVDGKTYDALIKEVDYNCQESEHRSENGSGSSCCILHRSSQQCTGTGDS